MVYCTIFHTRGIINVIKSKSTLREVSNKPLKKSILHMADSPILCALDTDRGSQHGAGGLYQARFQAVRVPLVLAIFYYTHSRVREAFFIAFR